MRRKSKLSPKQKVDICEHYLNGVKSLGDRKLGGDILQIENDAKFLVLKNFMKKKTTTSTGCAKN